MATPATYDELFASATAHDERADHEPFEPYHYQRQVAEEGLPELLEIPTGCGKTMAVVLGWLWRRVFHPDPAVRRATPRRLVYVLPQRVLVEQVTTEVRKILEALQLDDIPCAVLMGGQGKSSDDWRLHPEREAILVATQDMALSGALNRRYGESRWSWPIDFGLLNNDCHFVYDEIQLMGPALPTSRQLHGLRRALGTALSCASTWMSATVDAAQLATVDSPTLSSKIALPDTDRVGHLATRLHATRVIRQAPVASAKSFLKDVAGAVVAAHRMGTRTIAVANTVVRAVDLYRLVRKAAPDDVDVVLVHARFRPADRQEHLDRALATPSPTGGGTIVVTTQVLEAGVDITSDVLFTEAAPWSSVVQRAGRCNRDGQSSEATLLWAQPPSAAPYDEVDVKAAAEVLDRLEGQSLSTEAMVAGAPESSGAPIVHQVLRRRDLLELFDTLPDLSGSDIDISRFVRDADNRDVTVAWIDLGGDAPSRDLPLPAAALRCSVPIADAKHITSRHAWRFDHLANSRRTSPGGTTSTTDGAWVRCTNPRDLRPGMVVIIDAADGGYDPEFGWTPKSTKRVATATTVSGEAHESTVTDTDNGVGADPLSIERPGWVSLTQHLADVELEATMIDAAIKPPGLNNHQRRAAIVAARLHDLGKAHEVFQATLRHSAESDAETAEADSHDPPWAKSGGSRRSRHERPFFRHELASALALLDDGQVALEGEHEKDLIVYLVAAHHGRVRLGFRSLPGEFVPDGDFEGHTVALGIVDGESLPAVEVPGSAIPASVLDLSVMQLGQSVTGAPSWSQRMLPLRDRADLGPFRLGYLEATVRMADWRASATPGRSISVTEAGGQP